MPGKRNFRGTPQKASESLNTYRLERQATTGGDVQARTSHPQRAPKRVSHPQHPENKTVHWSA